MKVITDIIAVFVHLIRNILHVILQSTDHQREDNSRVLVSEGGDEICANVANYFH